MKINRDARELLDRYLLAVKKELTGKERVDITREIESYIFDILEERFGQEDGITQEHMEEVLKEMGAPRKAAAQYSPQRYLIGPRLFPVYILVLKIVAAVVLGALTLATIIGVVAGDASISWLSGLKYLGSLWNGVLSAAGMVTLIFAIIERTTDGKSLQELDELYELNLKDLPELPQAEKQPGRVGLLVEIVLGIIGITFFSYIQSTSGRVPYFFNPGSVRGMVPFFTENFLRFIPYLIALAGLDIARNATILMQDYHSAFTNWWHIVTRCANVVLLGFLIQALPLITLQAFLELTGAEAFATLEKLNNTGLAIALGLGIFGTLVDIVRSIMREVRSPVM